MNGWMDELIYRRTEGEKNKFNYRLDGWMDELNSLDKLDGWFYR